MLPFRSGRACSGSVRFALLLALSLSLAALAEEEKAKSPDSTPPPAKSGQRTINIPLAIGQEARGLVLPDFDMDGRMRGRFEAGAAKRLDEEQVQLTQVKMTRFTPENKPDLQIEMKDSVLNLRTRVVSTQHQTSIVRGDFKIVGDTMSFDSTTGHGTLVGNVKMVISNQAYLARKPANE